MGNICNVLYNVCKKIIIQSFSSKTFVEARSDLNDFFPGLCIVQAHFDLWLSRSPLSCWHLCLLEFICTFCNSLPLTFDFSLYRNLLHFLKTDCVCTLHLFHLGMCMSLRTLSWNPRFPSIMRGYSLGWSNVTSLGFPPRVRYWWQHSALPVVKVNDS